MKMIAQLCALALVACSLIASPVLAMSSTETIAASDQPVAPADLAIFVKDNSDFMDCHFKGGTFAVMSRDPQYNILMRHYNSAARAAQPSINNRAKFLEYRDKYGQVRAPLGASYGCAPDLVPLTTERR